MKCTEETTKGLGERQEEVGRTFEELISIQCCPTKEDNDRDNYSGVERKGLN